MDTLQTRESAFAYLAQQRHRLDKRQYTAVRETIGTMAIEHIYLSDEKIEDLIAIATQNSTQVTPLEGIVAA